MSTYLLYLNTAQKVDTVEHGMVRGLAIANPVTCESRALARDYLAIEAGDEIIACNGDGIRWSCLLYTSPSPRDRQKSRMPSSA